MSIHTLAEIEAAAADLAPDEVRKLVAFLERKVAEESVKPQQQKIDRSRFKGVLTLTEDPLEYQRRIRAEWD